MKSDSSKLIGLAILLGSAATGSSAVLLTHAGGLISETIFEPGTVLSTAVIRDSTSSDTLYFRYTVDPNSGGLAGENSYAGLNLYNGATNTLGVGNNWAASAYSVFGNAFGDLNSSTPEPGVTYQKIRDADLTTIAFSIAYNPAGNDTLTVWLNPDFGTEAGLQTANRTTTFTGDFSFNTISLREGGAGNGWNFSNIQVATSPTEIGFVPEPSAALLGGLGMLALLRRRRGA